jgi:hypothetical protein
MSYTGMSKNLFFVSVTVVPHRIFIVTELLDVFFFADFLSLYSFYVALNSYWNSPLLGAGSVISATLFSRPQSMWLRSHSQSEADSAREKTDRQREHCNRSSARVGIDLRVRWIRFCSPPSPSLAANHRQSRALLLRLLRCFSSSLCCSLCPIFTLSTKIKGLHH